MSPEKCISCLDEIKQESEKAHKAFFEKQEEKYDKFIERAEQRESRFSKITMFMLVAFSSVIGYSWMRQDNLINQVDKKAERSEVVTKGQYLLLQQKANEATANAIKNPSMASEILKKQTENDKQDLEFISRGATTTY